MDDETEVDPMGFLNTNAYDCDIDMMETYPQTTVEQLLATLEGGAAREICPYPPSM